jgi:hypothetical protein
MIADDPPNGEPRMIALLELLAEDAATAPRPAGPCALCTHTILGGDRYARLLNGKLAHTACIGRMTPGRSTERANQ